MSSMPARTRKRFLLNCNGCHTIERIMKSTYDAEASCNFPAHGRLLPRQHAAQAASGSQAPRFATSSAAATGRKTAEWLASVNTEPAADLGLPVEDRAAAYGQIHAGHYHRVRFAQSPDPAHDVVLDREGSVWYSDFGQMFPRQDGPEHGKVTQYPIPVVKPGWSEGTLDLEIDRDGNPWVGVMYQSAIAKFDRKPRSSGCGRRRKNGTRTRATRPYRDRGHA